MKRLKHWVPFFYVFAWCVLALYLGEQITAGNWWSAVALFVPQAFIGGQVIKEVRYRRRLDAAIDHTLGDKAVDATFWFNVLVLTIEPSPEAEETDDDDGGGF